jgi:hypothetical protein
MNRLNNSNPFHEAGIPQRVFSYVGWAAVLPLNSEQPVESTLRSLLRG